MAGIACRREQKGETWQKRQIEPMHLLPCAATFSLLSLQKQSCWFVRHHVMEMGNGKALEHLGAVDIYCRKLILSHE